MIRFGPSDLAKVMDMARDAAKRVTAKFIRPISLEFEKVYFPYLLINKKRYAGLYWTNTEKYWEFSLLTLEISIHCFPFVNHRYDKLDVKGLVTVRRDNCPLVSTMINTCLEMMLIKRDVPGAIEYAKSVISDLLCNRVDISQLVITKQLSSMEPDSPQAHVEVAKKMRDRDPGKAPALGDRVAYVIVVGVKGSKGSECAEDPMYVLDKNIPIDTRHYLEHQLKNPILGVFEPVIGEDRAKRIVDGEHTRTIVKVFYGTNHALMMDLVCHEFLFVQPR